MPVYWLSKETYDFPPADQAGKDGILAIGGDLSPHRLLKAYWRGIFPWFNPDEPILWWSPDPRFVLFPNELKVSKSMRPYFNQQKFHVTYDRHFKRVIRGCQRRREGKWGGTWITDDMVKSYCDLHKKGYAHSVEVWNGEELVGGLYGIALGRIFFGESMFTLQSNASKFGFITLVNKLKSLGFLLIDCQQQTRHLASLGARAIARRDFLKHLEVNESKPTLRGNWGEMEAFSHG